MAYQLISLLVDWVGRALRALGNFLRGATGVAFPEARCTKDDARLLAAHLEHKYSQPTRCC